MAICILPLYISMVLDEPPPRGTPASARFRSLDGYGHAPIPHRSTSCWSRPIFPGVDAGDIPRNAHIESRQNPRKIRMAGKHHDRPGIYGSEMEMFKELNCLSSPAVQLAGVDQPLGPRYVGYVDILACAGTDRSLSLKHLDKLAGFRGSLRFVVVVLFEVDI
jgi:hypothetical protein